MSDNFDMTVTNQKTVMASQTAALAEKGEDIERLS
jgi:hypothetical protein